MLIFWSGLKVLRSMETAAASTVYRSSFGASSEIFAQVTHKCLVHGICFLPHNIAHEFFELGRQQHQQGPTILAGSIGPAQWTRMPKYSLILQRI